MLVTILMTAVMTMVVGMLNDNIGDRGSDKGDDCDEDKLNGLGSNICSSDHLTHPPDIRENIENMCHQR